jgi:L-seryl-tRNA(Ser) seleniumtransferase
MVSRFRELPSVNDVLSHPQIAELVDRYSHDAVVDTVREELEGARDTIRSGGEPPSAAELLRSVASRAESRWRPWPQGIVNATGVVLHTNLGRAPLSQSSVEAMQVAATGYSDLEFDLVEGKRGSRQQHVSRLICQATGAEAALAVNNNASAVMLGLAAIATGKEVIVSRGEAVEIGGGFRIPDVLGQSGATLVEVGTTNRTYASDFAAAISDRTGAILSVHASNFRVMGFTHAPTIAELASVGARSGVPVLHDLGSGCLLETTRYGLAHEPMPQESAAAGVELSFFSGDKLLGGPQAGIIAGKREFIDTVSRHPLARAVRIDKLSMAALSATLLHYINGEAESEIPIWRMISASIAELTERIESWRSGTGSWASTVGARSAIGGGSLPGETLETVALRVDCQELGTAPQATLARLRQQQPPVIGRIEDNSVMLDPRTVLLDQDDTVATAVQDLGDM